MDGWRHWQPPIPLLSQASLGLMYKDWDYGIVVRWWGLALRNNGLCKSAASTTEAKPPLEDEFNLLQCLVAILVLCRNHTMASEVNLAQDTIGESKAYWHIDETWKGGYKFWKVQIIQKMTDGFFFFLKQITGSSVSGGGLRGLRNDIIFASPLLISPHLSSTHLPSPLLPPLTSPIWYRHCRERRYSP